MIEQLELQKLWFVAHDDGMEKELDVEDAQIAVSIFAAVRNAKGYASITDIPTDKLEGAILFQAYQFVFNNLPVTIEKDDDIEKYHQVLFLSEEEANSFKQELLDDMEEHYWDDDAERSALIDLGYDLDEEEDFSEISINEDRKWNDTLDKWYLESFDGLGYKLHYKDEVTEF